MHCMVCNAAIMRSQVLPCVGMPAYTPRGPLHGRFAHGLAQARGPVEGLASRGGQHHHKLLTTIARRTIARWPWQIPRWPRRPANEASPYSKVLPMAHAVLAIGPTQGPHRLGDGARRHGGPWANSTSGVLQQGAVSEEQNSLQFGVRMLAESVFTISRRCMWSADWAARRKPQSSL